MFSNGWAGFDTMIVASSDECGYNNHSKSKCWKLLWAALSDNRLYIWNMIRGIRVDWQTRNYTRNENTKARRKNCCSCAVDFGSSRSSFPFSQNVRRRMKNEHVIFMALGSISLSQGIYKKLGYLRESPVQMFWLSSEGSKWCFLFFQAMNTVLPRGGFQLFQSHSRYQVGYCLYLNRLLSTIWRKLLISIVNTSIILLTL